MIIQHISRIESVSYSTVVSTINFDLTTYCNVSICMQINLLFGLAMI